jgi:hypothetical protein
MRVVGIDDGSTDPLNGLEQGRDQLAREVAERLVVASRHYQDMPLEDGPSVEETHDVVLVEHVMGRPVAGDDGAEEAVHDTAQ